MKPMRNHFNYLRPDCLADCLDVLANYGKEVAVMAGGTDVMISLRNGSRKPRMVLDISRLRETSQVEFLGRKVIVGSTLTYSELINHQQIRNLFPALSIAMACVGSLQIRNVGTLGGNIANSSPAADSIPPLLIHDTEIIIQKAGAVRSQKLQELLVGPYKNTLESDELITGISIKTFEKGSREIFKRIGQRKGLTVARINAAVLGRLNDCGITDDIKISVGSVAPTPLRIFEVENCNPSVTRVS